MVLIEIVYCRITGKTRSMPKVHHFIPLIPWSVKKIKGKQRVMHMDKPYMEKKEEIKLVLDMSHDGAMFKMLEGLMSAVSAGGDGLDGGANTYEALKKLMSSGIPGMENLFANDGKGGDFASKFTRMSDDDKRRFIAAVTGADGKISSKAAAMLIAAAASNGDPEIANKIVKRMMTGLGDDIDPAMMAALMATTAMASQGASNEEILAAMQRELANSGLSPEEILAKTLLLQKAMSGDNSPAFINKTLQNALNAADLTQDDLSRALNVEKVMAATGASPEDLAKTMLIQAALAKKGVKAADIAQALNALTDKGELEALVRQVQEALKEEGISCEDIVKAMAISKALEGGKIRGLKEIEKMIENADLSSPEAVQELLKQAIESGALDADALTKSVLMQKVFAASGSNPKALAKTIALQKTLAENGMSKQEVANAMSLAMALGLDGGKSKKDIEKALREILEGGGELTAEDIEAVESLTQALEEGAEIPPEAIRLLKKAMKQRRGSVDNVAETLMASLAASGESKESIAKAMVKALKATGATPEEIARTMANSLEKGGASHEEIAKIMAKALAESGASTEEIARTLKETFKKAMQADPAAAADIARTMAEALAAAGASAEDIAQTMQEALAASLGSANATADDIMNIVETVARTMAEAGASPEDIAKAMKTAMKAASQNPEIAEELTKTMAKAMAAAGASGEEIARATQDALAASGMSKQEAAKMALEAVAASGASPEEIAKTMQRMQKETGLSSEELQQHIIDAMVESGASAEDVAKAMVQNKLLEAIGQTSDKMAKDLLQALRSGDDISHDKLEAILKEGGLTAETAAKVLMFQKALGSCGADPEDVARAILLQKALSAEGATPESIAKVVREIAAASGGLSEKEIDHIVDNITNGNIEYDDVMKALKFDHTLEDGSISAMPDSVKGLLKSLSGAVSKETIEKIASELMRACSADPESMARTVVIEKVMTELGLAPDDVSKFMRLQKSMYDSGASPQDIAMVMQALMEAEGKNMDKDELAEMLRERLGTSLSANDVANMLDLVDAFQNANIPPELVGQMALLQKSIEASLTSPEQSAKRLAEKMKRSDANPESLEKPLKDLLEKNGISLDGLESAVLLQKALLASGVSPEDITQLMELENAMLAAGKTPQEISNALQELAAKSGVDFKGVAQNMLAAMEQGRLKEDDILVSGNLVDAVSKAGIKAEVMENLKTLKKALERSGASDAEIAAIMAKATGDGLNKKEIEELMERVMDDPNLSKEEKEKLSSLKESLKQNKLKVAGLTPEKLDQIMTLQKVLEASGATQEEINAVITKATSKGLSENEIANIVNNALGSDNLSEKEKEQVKALEKSLKSKDLIVKGRVGVKAEVLDQLNDLQKAMEKAGCSEAEITATLAKAASEGLSEKEIKNIMQKVKDSGSLSAEEMEKLESIEENLKAGKLKNTGLNKKGMEQVLLLKKAMEAAGASEEEIKAVIAKATTDGLSEKEITDIINEAQKSNTLSEGDKAKLKGLEKTLRTGALIAEETKGIKKDVLEQVSDLQKILEQAGCSEEEIISLLAKATGEEGLTEQEINSITQRVENNPNISDADKKKMRQLEADLRMGNLQTPGMNADSMEQILTLKKALEATGATEDEINAIITKATSQGLNENEIASIVSDALSSKNLSEEQKKKIKSLEQSLRTGGLIVKESPGIRPEVMEQVSELQKLLEKSGCSQAEVASILAKATTEGLNEEEIAGIMKKVINNPKISKEDKQKMLIIEQNLKADNLKTAGMSQKSMEQIILLKKAMEASGATEEEINAVIAKATSQGLNNKEITEIMKKAQASKNLSKAEKEKLKTLEKDLKAGKMKLDGDAGVPPAVLDQIMSLQKALEDAGVPQEEILSIIGKATGKGLNAEEVSKIMAKIENDPNMTNTEKQKLAALEEALKAGDLCLDSKAREAVLDLAQAKNKKEIINSLQKLLEGGDVDPEGLAKAMLLQKLMAATGCSPEDLAKVCRIEKALIDSGAPASVVARTIAAVLEPRNKAMLDKMKKPLEELANGEAFKMSADAVEFSAKFGKAMTSNDQNSDETVKNVIDNALDIAGLSKDDLAKAMLIQKTLAASGISPEVLSQVMMLQKALAASGASAEEIADILSKACGEGLSDQAIDDLMAKAMSNENMSKEDIENMMQLQKSLKGGVLTKAGMTPEAMEQIVTLQKALEASGASPEEIARVLAEATSQNLSDEAIENLMSKALDNSSIDKEDFKNISDLQKNLKGGNLKAMGLTADVMENVMLLQKALEATGASQEEINKILQQATNEGLSEKQIEDLMTKVMNDPNLSEEQKSKMKDLGQALKEGKLKTGGLKADVMEQVSTLKKALEASGASAEEISAILAKATGEGLSEEEIAKVMSKIMNNTDMTPEEKKKMESLKEALKTGGLKTAGMTAQKLDQVLLLKKAMEATGASDAEVQAIIARATSGEGLSDKEVSDLMRKANASKKLTKEEKEQIKKLQKDLKDGNLKVGGVSAEALEQVVMLQKALEESGASEEEINQILSQAASGKGLSDKELNDVMSKVLSTKDISKDEFDGMVKLQDDLKGGKLKTSGMNPEKMKQVNLLQKALESTGASPEEIANIIAKATGPGLSDEAISDLMSKVLNNKDLSPEERENMMKLQQSLKDGSLKTGNIENMMQLQQSLLGLGKSGMTPEAMEQLVTLQKALEASGASPEEIAKALAEAASSNLSDKAIDNLMDKALANSSIDKEDFKNITELQKNLKGGNLKAMGLTADVMENVMFLQKALEATGASKEEINKILQQATNEGLSEKQIEDIMAKVMKDPNLSEEQKSKMKDLGQALKEGKLKTGGLKADALEQISTLQKALEASGASKEEISALLAKATGEGLSEQEIAKVMSKIMSNPNMTSEEKEKMASLKETLKTGGLKTAGMTAEKMDQVLLLKKAMEATGATEAEIQDVIARATSGEGLSEKEVSDLMKKASASNNLTKEEKEKMKKLQKDLKEGNLKVGGVSAEALEQVVMLQKALEESGASADEINKIMSQAASGKGLSDKQLSDVMSKVLSTKEISKEEFDGMVKLKDDLKGGKLKTSGVTAEKMEQVVLLQKALEAAGTSPEEIAKIIAKATGPGLSDEAISDIISKALKSKNLTPQDREKFKKLETSLKDGSLKIGSSLGDSIGELLASGQLDQETLAKALMVQKILSNAGMDPKDLGKAVLLQKAMLDAGASPEKIAKAMKELMKDSGLSMDQMMKQLEIELKSDSKLNAKDVGAALQFQKVLGAGSAADMILKKMSPESLKLIEEIAKGVAPGDTQGLINAMKEALGDALDDVTLQALEVSAAMKDAGASEEEIEEMMAMIMNKGGGISEEFLQNIKKAMDTGKSPRDTLKKLKDAMDSEMNSVTNQLRNTFLSKIPTEEEIKKTCRTLADKLNADYGSKSDVKLALMDIIDEALNDVMDYEPDADMLFNYLMVSALAEATDQIDRKGLKPTADELEEIARKGMLNMIERLLLEAELPDALKRLDVYGRSMDGIKQMLDFLLKDPTTGRQLKRQVAFLFDFEEIEHTTLLGLTLRDILKDAKHKLRPWELAKHRKVKGFRRSRIPKLAYSQVYCFYKMLPGKLDGPPIGMTYE